MKFNVCVMPTSIHNHCFDEVADSIEWALKELGHDVTRGALSESSRNVLFGVRPGDSIPPGSIIYNGEQVNSDGFWAQLVEVYKRFKIWDYSAANAARYPSGMAAPQVVRPGYSPVLERIPFRHKTHAVVFFGSSNPRRERLLGDLENRGVSVLRVPFGVYGKERDEYLSRARLCINVHYYESSVFEAIRCSYLAQNGLPTISEKSLNDENISWGIVGVPYDQLSEFVAAIAGNMDNIITMTQTQLQASRKVSLLEDVRAAVAELGPESSSGVKVMQGLVPTNKSPGVVEQDASVDDKSSGVVAQELASFDKSSGVVAQASLHKQKLTLSMIVKNEAHIIERCLASVKPWITGWCIVDTGSTDGTQEIIRNLMKEIPGALHELPWKEFDGSRNDALDLARQQANQEGWLLFIDSDEVMIVDGILEIPDGFDCYNGWITRCLGCVRWGRPTFARANRPWFYEMPRHEGLLCRETAPSRMEPLPNVTLLSLPDGGRAHEDAYVKFLRDAEVLEKWLLSHPGHSRCLFYLAQSYRDAADAKRPIDRSAMQKALMNYLKRAEISDGHAQEQFSAMFQASACMAALSYPSERIQNQLLKAFNFRPQRAEPMHMLAVHHRNSAQWPLAELFARRAVNTPPPGDVFHDYDASVYVWKAKDELATALTWLGKYDEAAALNEEILALTELPDGERQRIEENQETCMRNRGMYQKALEMNLRFLEREGISDEARARFELHAGICRERLSQLESSQS